MAVLRSGARAAAQAARVAARLVVQAAAVAAHSRTHYKFTTLLGNIIKLYLYARNFAFLSIEHFLEPDIKFKILGSCVLLAITQNQSELEYRFRYTG